MPVQTTSKTKEVFKECQHTVTSHPKLIRSLSKQLNELKKKDEVDHFAKEFVTLVKYSLVVTEQSASIDRTFNFVAKFIASVDTESVGESEEYEEEEEDEEEAKSWPRYFVRRCYAFFLDVHDVSNQVVRYRICQLITKLLNSMGDEAQLSENTFTKLQAAMLERLKDKATIVRVQAAQALFRLQDPSDENCRVTRALLRHLSCDPQQDVRCAVLKSLVPSTRSLIPVLKRTMDEKDSVRKQAYEFLALKIHVRSLTISQRVKLLRQGLNDRSEMVRKCCKEILVPSWSKMLKEKILDFVRCLDAHTASDITESAVKLLLTKKFDVDEFVAEFLDNDRILRNDQFSVESVFLWRVLCEHLKDEDVLEKVLPDLPKFCSFIIKYVESFENDDNVMELVDKEFIAEQMIRITHLYDLVDETHRKCFHEMSKYLIELPKSGDSLFLAAVKILKAVIPSSLDRAQYLMEAIVEIREPIDVIEVKLTAKEQRQNELKMAKLRVDANILRDEMESFVVEQDYEKAQAAKERLAEIEAQMVKLTEHKKPETEEVRVEKNDDVTMIKCLLLVCEIFEDVPFKLDVDRLHSLVDNLVLPSIRNESEIVRRYAVRALGLACFLNTDLASQHFLLFLQITQIDAEEVRLTALKIVFDLVMLNGLEMKTSEELQLDQSDGDDTVDSESESAAAASDSSVKLLSILLSQLDSEVSTVHTVAAEGIAKLLLAGRVISPKTVSRLIIMWFSPVNQDNEYLINCLGVFFPVFVAASAANRAMVAGAFMPTLRILFQAPVSSPLSVVDVASVGSFMVHLTVTPKVHERNLKLNNLHDNLSVTICNEILRSPKHFGVPTLVDILRQFRISQDAHSLLKKLINLCTSITKKIKDKRTLLKVKKFLADVDALLAKIVTGEGELSQDEGGALVVPESPVVGKRMPSSDSDTTDY